MAFQLPGLSFDHTDGCQKNIELLDLPTEIVDVYFRIEIQLILNAF